jgi:NAD(P)-dependent dehydrogenase (short-subunit alcohol dehydrogenase family)
MPEVRRTALVTGSTHGVGHLVAQGLADAEFDLILHGRDEAEGRRLVDDVQRRGVSTSFHRVDLASLQAVRTFADQLSREHPRLELLINNAGVGFGRPGGEREVSKDGYELRFAVNFLAPFLLTHLLKARIAASAPARIINVGSLGQAPLDFGDLMLEHGYNGITAYRRSKLALVMFTFDLAEELRGRGVTVNCVHPATFMDTGMVHEAQVKPQSSPEEGAEAILHLALSEDVRNVTGVFFDGKRPAEPNPQAHDAEARRRLREAALRLTGLAAGPAVAREAAHAE